ncbi:hypothetical protein [Arthrobacter sp. RCC_34]|uniref:hypothetical protein n=1 Tax=Arthrobacter sp. RCC_34 TaxID=3239230 RepID=UPI003525E86B
MPAELEPRVIHINDCANVARTLVDEAHRRNLSWDFMPPDAVRPGQGFGSGMKARLAQLPYQLRHASAALGHDVLHFHYGTTPSVFDKPFLPRKPYLLHLHGTDIRTQWPQPAFHDQIQRAIDGAQGVYYTTLDLEENATAARPDAQYLPAPLMFDRIPEWSAPEGRTRISFASRWDDSKNVALQLETAAALVKAFPDAEVLGLDWGPGAAEAQRLGVRLVPKMPHGDFLDYLAGASVVVGQSAGILAVSELEALAAGVVVACPGTQWTGPAGEPPVLQGTPEEIVEQVRVTLEDPAAMASRLSGPAWVRKNHSAADQVALLQSAYRAAASSS